MNSTNDPDSGPQALPLSMSMTVKDLERALKSESESLQKVHSQIRVALFSLQVRTILCVSETLHGQSSDENPFTRCCFSGRGGSLEVNDRA
jgi:hypothetical protein